MANLPNVSQNKTDLGNLEVGKQYVLLTCGLENQEGTSFYEVLSPINPEQWSLIETSTRHFGIDAFIVNCTFSEDTTVIIENPEVTGEEGRITYHLDRRGNGIPVTKDNLQ